MQIYLKWWGSTDKRTIRYYITDAETNQTVHDCYIQIGWKQIITGGNPLRSKRVCDAVIEAVANFTNDGSTKGLSTQHFSQCTRTHIRPVFGSAVKRRVTARANDRQKEFVLLVESL